MTQLATELFSGSWSESRHFSNGLSSEQCFCVSITSESANSAQPSSTLEVSSWTLVSGRGAKTAEGTPYSKVSAVANGLAESANEAMHISSLRNSSSEASFLDNSNRMNNNCRSKAFASDFYCCSWLRRHVIQQIAEMLEMSLAISVLKSRYRAVRWDILFPVCTVRWMPRWRPVSFQLASRSWLVTRWILLQS